MDIGLFGLSKFVALTLMNRLFYYPLCFLFVSVIHGYAQNKPGMQLPIRKAKNPIHLDGKLDEPDWAEATVAKDFFLNYPVDTTFARFQTEARLTFDDSNLYVSFVCYDDRTPDIVQSLRRDFEFDFNDNMGVYIGPYNDGINGFYFIITPKGVQLEGTIAGGGTDGDSYNPRWDNKWYSKVVKADDRWIAEMVIPFKSFRYKSDAKEWNITFLRYDLKRNASSSWIATPIQFIPASFAYSGKLVWEDPAPHQGTNISLIPYIAGGTSKDSEVSPPGKDSDLQVGFDAKIGVTPSLNLDLTVNPDFSQVEVDRQVINLTRFEFQFPERRQFFLENNDLFDRMGFPEARPFFSRRVGIVRDTSETLRRVPILYGARLSGSLSKNWRMSLLNMQTREKLNFGLPSQNFMVAAIQRNFGTQSNIQFSFVNKESIGIKSGDSLKYFNSDLWKNKWNGTDSVKSLNKYNRVATVDVELRNKDNSWYSSMYFSHSFDDFHKNSDQAGGFFMQYKKRNYQFFVGETFVQKNYTAEAGYVPSRGVYPGVAYSYVSVSGTLYPKNKNIVQMGPVLDLSMTVIPGAIVSDKTGSLGYSINFRNTSYFYAGYSFIFQRLTNAFNPIDKEKFDHYLEGEKYDWQNASISYQSDQRKVFRYSLGSTMGSFYNGSNYNANGELSYRYQPFGSLSVRFDYNDLRLPGDYGKEKLFIVSPRMDMTFTDKIFLTTFVQYNTLDDNVNLNARFQWRYKPASDFFVVYTENYLPSNLVSKNRALVFKLTYWFNI
jgi:Domain of unknown function (DUF5916)/Carbohydrate family 9 binding domain-like